MITGDCISKSMYSVKFTLEYQINSVIDIVSIA